MVESQASLKEEQRRRVDITITAEEDGEESELESEEELATCRRMEAIRCRVSLLAHATTGSSSTFQGQEPCITGGNRSSFKRRQV